MMIKKGTLIMAADGAKHMLFRNDGDTLDPSLVTLDHEEIAHPPSREQGTDTPGRTQSRLGDRRSSYGETDWHTQSEHDFARHAAAVLEEAAAGDPKAEIIVIAAPATLGQMRKHYGRETRERLCAEIAKDLAGNTTDDIVDTIAAHGA